MKKISKIKLTLLFIGIVSSVYGQATTETQATTLSDGVTLTDGVFYASYSIQGMTYNPSTKSYESSSGNSGSNLPDPTPLLEAYNQNTTPEDKQSYFSGLNPDEQASLFGVLDQTDQSLAMSTIGVSTDFLKYLPSGQAGPALNYLALTELEEADLSGLDLSGWDTTGLAFLNVNLSGANISIEQLNAAGALWADLSNRDLTVLNTTGKALSANLAGSTISIEQLNAASWLGGSNLSNRDLSGLNTVGKYLAGINITGSTISVEQLNAAADIRWLDLSGKDLTNLVVGNEYWGVSDGSGKLLVGVNLAGSTISVAQLNQSPQIFESNLSGLNLQGFSTTDKSLGSVNFSNTNITVSQLAASSNINGINLVGTGITRETLQAALDSAGKTGQFFNLDSIAF